jgi:hypothetical protein
LTILNLLQAPKLKDNYQSREQFIALLTAALRADAISSHCDNRNGMKCQK